MSDTKKLCLSVEPMHKDEWRWEWRNHSTRELFTSGMAATERGAFEAATASVVEACNMALNEGRQEIEALKKRLEATRADKERLDERAEILALLKGRAKELREKLHPWSAEEVEKLALLVEQRSTKPNSEAAEKAEGASQ
jgi:hypothetical protein